MSSFLQGLQSRAKDIRESLTPALSTSAFETRGVLTPQQFVSAGDELVASCPTWEWAGSTKEGSERSYLPKGKQFLVTRGVPSKTRCRGKDFSPSAAMMKDNGEGWMIEDVAGDGQGSDDDFDLCDGDDKPPSDAVAKSETPPSTSTPPPTTSGGGDDDDDDEYADMDDFTDPTLASDLSSLTVTPSPGSSTLRRYDVMISYDKYYQTPRVWLLGYAPSGTPLTGQEMFEDVMEDYVNRTVTIEKVRIGEN